MCVLEAVSKPEARFTLRHITADPETQTLKSDLASVHLFYLEIAPPLNVLNAHTIIFDRSPLGRPLSTADYQMEFLRVRSSVQVVLRTQSANQSGPSVRPSQFLTYLSGLQRFAHSFEGAYFTGKPYLARGPLTSAVEKPRRTIKKHGCTASFHRYACRLYARSLRP